MRYILFSLLLAGCATQVAPPSLETITVDEAWRERAMKEYKAWTLTRIETSSTAKFEDDVKIRAYYNTGTDESTLTAHGTVHFQNEYGAMVRHFYTVMWKTKGKANPNYCDWGFPEVMIL